MDIPSIATSGVALVFSAVALVFSSRQTRATQTQADASKLQAEAALQQAKTDAERLHAERLPQFEITLIPYPGDRAELRVGLIGPEVLCHLDAVTLSIRDDQQRKPVISGGPTQADIDRQIWGPYRFAPGIDGASDDGRTFTSAELQVGDWITYHLVRATAPPWADSIQWRKDYDNAPLRLLFQCQREGYQQWRLPREVRAERGPNLW